MTISEEIIKEWNKRNEFSEMHSELRNRIIVRATQHAQTFNEELKWLNWLVNKYPSDNWFKKEIDKRISLIQSELKLLKDAGLI